jgi:predicted DNA-binding transcriptional regulator AlpA
MMAAEMEEERGGLLLLQLLLFDGSGVVARAASSTTLDNRVNVKLDEYLNNRAEGIASFSFVALMAGSSTSQIYGIMEERYPTMFFGRRQGFHFPKRRCLGGSKLPYFRQ